MGFHVRGMYFKYTPWRARQCAGAMRLLGEGLSTAEVAEKLQFTLDYVHGLITQRDLWLIPSVGSVYKWGKPQSKVIQRRAAIVERFKAGATVEALCTEFHRSNQTILGALKQAGYTFNRKIGRPRKPNARLPKIYELRAKGTTTSQAAKELGISRQAMWQILKALGLKYRNLPGPELPKVGSGASANIDNPHLT
jgi:transposase